MLSSRKLPFISTCIHIPFELQPPGQIFLSVTQPSIVTIVPGAHNENAAGDGDCDAAAAVVADDNNDDDNDDDDDDDDDSSCNESREKPLLYGL